MAKSATDYPMSHYVIVFPTPYLYRSTERIAAQDADENDVVDFAMDCVRGRMVPISPRKWRIYNGQSFEVVSDVGFVGAAISELVCALNRPLHSRLRLGDLGPINRLLRQMRAGLGGAR